MAAEHPTKGKAEPAANEPREKLLEAARRHFALHGYQGASLKSIAEDAGAASSLINYHFTDKEGLFNACMEPFARGRMEAVMRILGEVKNREGFKVRIQLFAEEMVDGFIRDPYSFAIVDREVLAGNPVILKIFENTLLVAFKSVVGFFQEAKKNGLLRDDLDPTTVSMLLFVSCCDAVRKDILGRKYLNLTFHDPQWRRLFVSHVASLFAEGVLK